MKNIAIFGCGGFGREVKWLIDDINRKSNEWNFIGYFDDDFTNALHIPDVQKIGNLNDLNNWKDSLCLVFAIGNPQIKKRIIINVNNPNISYPILIHPTVCIGNDVEIGKGSIICAACIITVNIKIGEHVILNLGCTVGHDSIIGDFSSFMPSVNISGEVVTGECVYAGTGVKIINRLQIGDETIIGAGAVVSKSLPSKCTAVGIPAKPIKYH